jgi:ferredoxin
MNPKDVSKPSGPVTVHDYSVVVDRDLCIGAATCVAVAAHTFALDSEAKAIILDSAENDTPEIILESAHACPVAAIIIKDAKGNQVFPI